jgi:hypothetical protein
VQHYVFPPSHAELLSLRGTYKKQVGSDANTNAEFQPDSGSDKKGGQGS